MSVCVIIQGWQQGGEVFTEEEFAEVGSVVARCNPCVNTERVTFPERSTGAGMDYEVAFSKSAELKPLQTYVFTFPTSSAADGWLTARRAKLAGKVVFKINPAEMVSGKTAY